MGAFHSTKISENSGSKSNGTEIFRKFVSKISVRLSRLSFFSGNLEIPEISCSIWHFYPVWIGPSSFSRGKLQDGAESFESHNTGCKMICYSSSLFLIENENVRILFPGKLCTCRSEFPVGQFARFAYSSLPREKFVSFDHNYQGRVEFWMRVKLYMKQVMAL